MHLLVSQLMTLRLLQGDQQAEEVLAFQPAARYAPIMDQVYAELVSRCAPLQGARLWAQGLCRQTVYAHVCAIYTVFCRSMLLPQWQLSTCFAGLAWHWQRECMAGTGHP